MDKLRSNPRLVAFIILLGFSLLCSYIIYTTALRFNNDRHLVLLAERFLHFKISLSGEGLPAGDVADYFSNFYLYFGPFASIFLMPFVLLLGKGISQTLLGITSMIASFGAIFYIAKTHKFNIENRLWLCLFYVFSTVVFSASLINITAYQIEVFGSSLVLIALAAYFTKKRPLIIGIFLGLAVLTRLVFILAVAFFILEFFQKRLSKKDIVLIIIPVIISITAFGLYNQRRFHSFFETGYKYNITLKSFPLTHNLEFGTTSITHIPANLYSLFIMPPDPLRIDNFGFVLKFPYLKANPWGMAIWFTSPLFLVLLYKFRRNKYTISSAVTIALLLFPLLTYYSIGFAQYGYRYALDFLPFLFLILLSSLNGRLERKELILITIGVIFNCIYITSLWDVYPLFGINR